MKQILRRWIPALSDSSAADGQLVTRILQHAERLRCGEPSSLTTERVRLQQLARSGTRCTDPHLLVPALALVVEGVRRTYGITPYNVQILAGVKMARGTVVEMQTGEGKTLATAFPALLFSLTAPTVHVMTANAYLAERDHAKLRPVFNLLGIQLGLLKPGEPVADRQAAYNCPITYGPDYEFGFDYLRDQLALLEQPTAQRSRFLSSQSGETRQMRQCGLVTAIIDEADSVLIDEAGTPLIISQQARAPHPHPEAFWRAKEVADSLVPDQDFTIDARFGIRLYPAAGRHLREAPSVALQKMTLQRPWQQYIEQAMFARYMLRRDVDYVVTDGTVRIVDQDTGRIFEDRTWQAGLHQAVEAKEGLSITAESKSSARICRQRFFRLYRQTCGLTGTAVTAQRELWDVYGLPVEPIPLRVPSRRSILPTRYFLTDAQKRQAVVQDIAARRQTGQPLLIGTATIAQSEQLARELDALQIRYELLNGKQTASEAEVVARAGQRGAITIATNMAGRGTDIQLAPEVRQLGGLHVIATQRHESERVDRQLIGRCARQGDPGSCQFFVSAEDRLIAAHSPILARQMQRLAGPDGEIHTDLSAQIKAVQAQAERAARLRRHELSLYDDWLTDLVKQL